LVPDPLRRIRLPRDLDSATDASGQRITSEAAKVAPREMAVWDPLKGRPATQ